VRRSELHLRLSGRGTTGELRVRSGVQVRLRMRSAPGVGERRCFVARQLTAAALTETKPRTWPPMSPAAKRGPRTSGLSPLNWRFTPASHRPA